MTDENNSEGKPERDEDYEAWRNELRYWPYTIHQIDDTLDPSLIEGRAKQLLFRALTTQSVTAFMGSGASAAYGRKSWSEWKNDQIGVVDELAEAFLTLVEAARDRIAVVTAKAGERAAKPPSDETAASVRMVNRWLENTKQMMNRASWDVENLYRTFEAANSERGDFPGGEGMPILFEIAKRLHNLLQQQRSLFWVDRDIGVERSGDDVSVEVFKASGADEEFWSGLILLGARIDREAGAPAEDIEKFLGWASENGLFDDLSASHPLVLAEREFENLMHQKKMKLSFEKLAKSLLVDEAPHALDLLESAFDLSEESGRKIARSAARKRADAFAARLLDLSNDIIGRNLKRDLDGIAENPRRYAVLTPFRLAPTKMLYETAREKSATPSHWNRFIDGAISDWAKYIREQNLAPLNVERLFLTPTSRFMLTTMLQLVEDPTKLIGFRYGEAETDKAAEAFFAAPEREDFKSRRSIIADRFDPLAIVSDGLGVNRFLTTNYDFEIERFFQDKGYRYFDPHKALREGVDAADDPRQYRTNGFGGFLKDETFTAETATDLLAFAAGGGGADASVFHLHGRATDGAADGIVATERDYMNMYLRGDENREVVDESILLAFAARPILFIGFGMEEADILRPMRQFMSDQDRAVGYRATALLPAINNYEERAKVSSGLYMRYGAHTIFYGSGETEICGKRRRIDWLNRITSLIDAIREKAAESQAAIHEAKKKRAKEEKLTGADRLADFLPLEDDRPLMGFSWLSSRIGVVGDDLKSAGADQEEPAIFRIVKFPEAAFDECLKEAKKNSRNHRRNIIDQSEIRAQGGVPEHTIEEKFQCELQKIEIVNCWLTSHRYHETQTAKPERDVVFDARDFTKFYVARLTEILRMALAPRFFSEHSEQGDLDKLHRSLNAMITALDGIKSAILTATLCASLKALEEEWRAWWRDWQSVPTHREAIFETLPNADVDAPPDSRLPKGEEERRRGFVLPRRDIRHKVENTITNLTEKADLTVGSFGPHPNYPNLTALPATSRTGVRIFDHFISDVAQAARRRKPPMGRALTTIAAARGQGKGVFFSTFATRLGLSAYLKAMHPEDRAQDAGVPPAVFTTAMFANLSFSTELASIYDMMVRSLTLSVAQLATLLEEASADGSGVPLFSNPAFLEAFFSETEAVERPAPANETKEARKVREAANRRVKAVPSHAKRITGKLDGYARTERIRFLFREFARLSRRLAKVSVLEVPGRFRLLVVVNAAELMFDAKNNPKNMEIADYLGDIGGEEMQRAPVDFVFIGDLNEMGRIWRGLGVTRVSLIDDDATQRPDPENADAQDRVVRMIFRDPVEMEEAKRTAAKHEILLTRINAGAKPNTSLLAPETANYVHISRAVDQTSFIVDNFPILAMALMAARRTRLRFSKLAAPRPVLFKRLNLALRSSFERRQKRLREAWAEPSPPNVNHFYHAVRTEMLDDAVRLHFDNLMDNLRAEDWRLTVKAGDRTPLIEELRERFDPPAGSADAEDWRDLKRVLGGNRYCLTILLAAAEHLVFSEADFIKGGEAANSLLAGVVTALRNASETDSEDSVFDAVMGVYQRTSRRGDPARDHDLHQLLLRAISVIGAPVSPNVLVRLPDIRAYFNRTTFDGKLSRRRMVAQALAALAERGLVFRLSPHPKLLKLAKLAKSLDAEKKSADAEHNDWCKIGPRPPPFRALSRKERETIRFFEGWPAEQEYRYAVHRQMQSHSFQRLGLLTAAPVTANYFAPTLYASMPSRVVRLSREGYLYLRRLLLGLSQYPDIRHEDAARAMPIFRDDDMITRIQALRAGLSVARTCFSIAAVSRFDDDMNGLEFIRRRGHFETYRVRLRWIIRKAWEVLDPDAPKDCPIENEQINAIFIDEIVWLYNEVAVTALVEGNLPEALEHARQAIFLNRRIEGEIDGGRMHNMLSLNLAIIQFERGRIAAAEARLNAIVESEPADKKRVALLARGYLALVAQVKGRTKEAMTRLSEVIDRFEKRNEDRALSLLLFHHARLVAKTNPEKAKALINRANDYAEKGGHEDVRHRIMIGAVRNSQGYEDDPQDRMEQDRIRLTEARKYADTMGIRSLQVEVLHAEGEMLMSAGDYSSAGRFLTKAMAIARRNDMTLRLNAVMTNYARVLLKRRRIASAKRLLHASMSMAKRSGYATEVARIHEVQDEADRLTAAD